MPLAGLCLRDGRLPVGVLEGVVAVVVEAVGSPVQPVDSTGKASFDLARPSVQRRVMGSASREDNRSTWRDIVLVVVEARNAGLTCAARRLAPSSSRTLCGRLG